MENTNGIKTFKEINEINVNNKVEKKNGLSFLSWAYAWAEIKKIDSNANYVIHENKDELPFFESFFGIDVKVTVTVFGVSHTMRLPVMDGANKAMKREAYTYSTKNGDKKCDAATGMDINKTIMRCLVKAIGMHGLGLYIYAGEDMPETVGDGTETPGENTNTNNDKPKFIYVVEGGKPYDIRDQIRKAGFDFDKEAKIWIRKSNNPDLGNSFNFPGSKVVRYDNDL